MYNLYIENKKLQEIQKKEQDKIRLIKQEQIHKNKTKNLALKYEDRLRKLYANINEKQFEFFTIDGLPKKESILPFNHIIGIRYLNVQR